MKTIIVKKLETTTIEVIDELLYIVILDKGWKGKKTIKFEFKKRNSRLNFFTFILGKDNQSFQFETISDHKAENTYAHYHIRGALLDKSKIDYKGDIKVHKKAQHADTYLANHTMMLSDQAKTKTIPCLEIEADQVKAGHAATIGKVNDDMMFYLESRGLDKATGQDILIKGFLSTDIKLIPDEKIRDLITKELSKIC
ncbi:MAG: SufD family Fe-S cluster assembly protein [Nitrospirota bacterium]